MNKENSKIETGASDCSALDGGNPMGISAVPPGWRERVTAMLNQAENADDWCSKNSRLGRAIVDDCHGDDDLLADFVGLLCDEIERLYGEPTDGEPR